VDRHPVSGRLLPRRDEPAAVLAVVKAKPFGWPPMAASLDHRSTRRRKAIAVGTEGWSLQSNIGMAAKAEHADIPRFFLSINYRGPGIVHPKIPCHFSLPSI
jgi:hypothetical protein